jgi:uncharacterized protein YdbL (DUF1318 family)
MPRAIVILFLIVLTASCAPFTTLQINLSLPPAEVQKAEDEFVQDIDAGNQKPASRAKEPSSSPPIRTSQASMRETFLLLKPFYEGGAVGENNSGFVEVRDTESLSIKERAQLSGLIYRKNNERMSLYREIIAANKVNQEELPNIQKIFANSWRGKCHAGWWV